MTVGATVRSKCINGILASQGDDDVVPPEALVNTLLSPADCAALSSNNPPHH